MKVSCLSYCQGSNGEVAYLSEEERVAMVQAVRGAVPKETGKLIIAGRFKKSKQWGNKDWFPLFIDAFLDALSHLYKRVCPSVRRSVTHELNF